MTHKELKRLHAKLRPKLDTHPAIGTRGYKREVRARVEKFLEENQKLAKGGAEVTMKKQEELLHP